MLQEEIAQAKLSKEHTACFYHLLVDVVSDNGRPNTMDTSISVICFLISKMCKSELT